MADAIKWGPGRLAQVIEYLDHEIRLALDASEPLRRQWRDWLEQYRAPAKQPIKKFPFEGAANRVYPITATDVDQQYAKEMQTIFASNDLWTLEALNEDWVDAVKPLQDALSWLDHNALKLWSVCKRVKLEKFKLGTGIYKHGWLYEKRPTYGYDLIGKVVRGNRIRGLPFVDHVRNSDFLIPAYSYAIQPDDQGGAPWLAERLRINANRFRSLANSSAPFMPGIDRDAVNAIVKFLESDVTDHDAKIQTLDYVKRGSGKELDFDTSITESPSNTPSLMSMPRDVELWEVHVRWPTGGQGTGAGTDASRNTQGNDDSEDDCVLWYHLPTRRVVRAIYNPYHHGKRPYEVERMFPGDGFWGIGICEQKEMFQTAGSELINFMYDNVLASNSIMLAAKMGANITAGEPIYPYKIWMTEGDPRAEIMPFQMAQIYQSLPQMIEMIEQLGQRRTGVSDIQLGNLQNMPGRTPATSMISALAEGNRRPDLAVKDSRYEGLSVIGLRILQYLQQFASSPVDVGGQTLLQLMVKSLGMPEGMFAGTKLMTPMDNPELGVGVSITATSGAANKEVAKQNMVALLQLAGQITPQFIQLIQVAQQAQGTPVGAVALQSALGLRELYTRALEQYDVRNIGDVAPDIKADTQGLGGQAPTQGPTGANGTNGGPGGLLAPAGGAPELGSVLNAAGARG